jgi:hypothetical protein
MKNGKSKTQMNALRDACRSQQILNMVIPSTSSFKYLNEDCLVTERSRHSSVSIVSGYGLDDWAIRVPTPAKAKDFSCNL